MTQVYLTLWKDRRMLPDGLVTDSKRYGTTHGVNDESNGISHEACADCEEDRVLEARLALLTEIMQGLGYEVSFTTEPDKARYDEVS